MSTFTKVKLIIPFAFILFLTVFSIPENSSAAKKIVVQIAASKTPLDLNNFISKNGIDNYITELKTDSWILYVVGDFKNFKEASAYASVLIDKTKLTNAFARVIELDTMQVVHVETNKDTLQVVHLLTGKDSVQYEKGEQINANPDTAQPNPKPDDKKVKSESQKYKDFPRTLLTGEKLIRIFLSADKAERLKYELIEFGEKNVPQYFRNSYITLVEVFFQYPLIFVFFILILFFIVNIISVLLILNYTVGRKKQKVKYDKIYGKIYEEALLSYIFGEIEWEEAVVRLKNIKKRQNRKILISLLLNFHENLKGEVEKFIPEIFYNLGLYKDSFKSAKSSFSHKKVQGIRELTYLYPEGAKKIVPDYINYPDDTVRAEAQLAYIRLNQDNPFDFLSSLTKPLTRWTQLSAFYLIRLHQLPVPSFSNYLNSKHPTIQNFSLQMIIYFQQLENVSEIFSMMNSEVERTRFLCYKAINDLRLYEGRVLIRKKFRKETYKNKLEIIKALKNIGTEEDFQFIELIIKSESISLKLEACRSMYFMNQEGYNRLIELSKESNPELKQFIAHITDPRN